MNDVGLRVIRGPDWHWDDQDGGEGFVGTITEFSSKTAPDRTVVVVWDIGYRTNYRIGYDRAYDLRVFDNSTTGITHPRIMCNGCNKLNFSGMRFKCCQCYDYDLCLGCYMNDCHELSHVFYRFDIDSHDGGIELPPREGSKKTCIYGIFPGAKVIRGQNWDWEDQDGGAGHVGNVTDIRGWDVETDRSVASVTWVKTGVTNVYRVGHKGKVDIRCVKAAPWGQCYVDHLPILGKTFVTSPRVPQEVISFNSGEKVRVDVNEEQLKNLQQGHGGWNPRMIQYIGEVGVVHRVTDKGDVRVQFENCGNRWTFHPRALIKVNTFKVGDNVRIINDVAKVKELQKGHGEWLDIMTVDMGKIGQVTKIYSDGDLRVHVENQAWTLNPQCVEAVQEVERSEPLNKSSEELRRAITGITQVIQDLESSDETSIEHILKEVERGNLEFLDKYFSKTRSEGDLADGKTCLHIACHEGQLKLVQFLLSIGAAPEAQDTEGDTALHYATYGNQPAIIELLLSYGMNVNVVNKSRCSALHISVNRQFHQCVLALLRFHCNPNLQDLFGDTALHDAVGKGDLDLVTLLITNNEIDLTIVNNQGFNVIHTCALKGYNGIMEKLLQKSASLVDVKKDDGFAAIHLAALNGYMAVTKILILKGNSDINLKNGRNQTPLHLAASQEGDVLCQFDARYGEIKESLSSLEPRIKSRENITALQRDKKIKRFSVVELLIKLGADVSAEDENGDSPLHLALSTRKCQIPPIDFNPEEAPSIFNIYNKLKNANSNVENGLLVALICYLLQSQCPINKPNKNGVTPLHLIKKCPIFNVLEDLPDLLPLLQISESSREASTSSPTPVETVENAQNENLSDIDHQCTPVECLVCSELVDDNVTLEPCQHKLACEECSSRMKKCIKCGAVISKRVTRDGRIVSGKSRQRSADRLKYLETKIAEIEEVHCCPICLERRRNIVFLCGHGACDRCSCTLTMCHMCRTVITKKINLY